jgi:hypothetical protein
MGCDLPRYSKKGYWEKIVKDGRQDAYATGMVNLGSAAETYWAEWDDVQVDPFWQFCFGGFPVKMTTNILGGTGSWYADGLGGGAPVTAFLVLFGSVLDGGIPPDGFHLHLTFELSCGPAFPGLADIFRSSFKCEGCRVNFALDFQPMTRFGGSGIIVAGPPNGGFMVTPLEACHQCS